MNNNQEKVWILQLVKYFMTNGYQRIAIFSPQAKQNGEDYWLLALEEKKYAAVHISAQNNEQRKQSVPLVLATVSELSKALQDEVKILDISVNAEAVEEKATYGMYAACNPYMPINSELLMLYPGIDKAICEVSDPAKAQKELLKQIGGFSGRKKANIFEMFAKSSLATKIIVGVCILLYIASEILYVGYKYELSSVLIALGAYYKAAISICGQYERFIVSGFLHSGLLHLFCNILSYMNLALITDKLYSKFKTVIILLAGIVFGNVLVFAAETNVVEVGLSGGVYALFGATLVEYIAGGYLKEPRIRIKLGLLIGVNVIISLMPNTSMLAHFGGLVIGMALGVLFNAKISKAFRINTAICTAVLSVFVGWLAFKNINFTQFYPDTDHQVCEIYREFKFSEHADSMEKQLNDYYAKQGANYAEGN